jgi:hypothetical protein
MISHFSITLYHFFLTLYQFVPLCTSFSSLRTVTYRCVPLRPYFDSARSCSRPPVLMVLRTHERLNSFGIGFPLAALRAVAAGRISAFGIRIFGSPPLPPIQNQKSKIKNSPDGTLGTPWDGSGTLAKLRIANGTRPWDGGTAVHPQDTPPLLSCSCSCSYSYSPRPRFRFPRCRDVIQKQPTPAPRPEQWAMPPNEDRLVQNAPSRAIRGAWHRRLWPAPRPHIPG